MAGKILKHFSIRECRYFLREQSAANYPNIYPFIQHYVKLYDEHKSQYIIKDRRPK